ncbi:MAG: hypothetical protein KAU48_06110 [Candidatus Thorarchaeota archaeon]|nr:hypothetical protein [Candidatus Thorarchaeota archaeon]
MQEIPIIDASYHPNLLEFVAAIVILVLLVVILGSRNRPVKLQYWVISAIEVAVFAISWLLLAIMTDVFFHTYISLPVGVTPIVIVILNVLSYLGFCILLIVIEMHRGPSKTESEKTTVINE